jgi:hypothetical protein
MQQDAFLFYLSFKHKTVANCAKLASLRAADAKIDNSITIELTKLISVTELTLAVCQLTASKTQLHKTFYNSPFFVVDSL